MITHLRVPIVMILSCLLFLCLPVYIYGSSMTVTDAPYSAAYPARDIYFQGVIECPGKICQHGDRLDLAVPSALTPFSLIIDITDADSGKLLISKAAAIYNPDFSSYLIRFGWETSDLVFTNNLLFSAVMSIESKVAADTLQFDLSYIYSASLQPAYFNKLKSSRSNPLLGGAMEMTAITQDLALDALSFRFTINTILYDLSSGNYNLVLVLPSIYTAGPNWPGYDDLSTCLINGDWVIRYDIDPTQSNRLILYISDLSQGALSQFVRGAFLSVQINTYFQVKAAPSQQVAQYHTTLYVVNKTTTQYYRDYYDFNTYTSLASSSSLSLLQSLPSLLDVSLPLITTRVRFANNVPQVIFKVQLCQRSLETFYCTISLNAWVTGNDIPMTIGLPSGMIPYLSLHSKLQNTMTGELFDVTGVNLRSTIDNGTIAQYLSTTRLEGAAIMTMITLWGQISPSYTSTIDNISLILQPPMGPGRFDIPFLVPFPFYNNLPAVSFRQMQFGSYEQFFAITINTFPLDTIDTSNIRLLVLNPTTGFQPQMTPQYCYIGETQIHVAVTYGHLTAKLPGKARDLVPFTLRCEVVIMAHPTMYRLLYLPGLITVQFLDTELQPILNTDTVPYSFLNNLLWETTPSFLSPLPKSDDVHNRSISNSVIPMIRNNMDDSDSSKNHNINNVHPSSSSLRLENLIPGRVMAPPLARLISSWEQLNSIDDETSHILHLGLYWQPSRQGTKYDLTQPLVIALGVTYFQLPNIPKFGGIGVSTEYTDTPLPNAIINHYAPRFKASGNVFTIDLANIPSLLYLDSPDATDELRFFIVLHISFSTVPAKEGLPGFFDSYLTIGRSPPDSDLVSQLHYSDIDNNTFTTTPSTPRTSMVHALSYQNNTHNNNNNNNNDDDELDNLQPSSSSSTSSSSSSFSDIFDIPNYAFLPFRSFVPAPLTLDANARLVINQVESSIDQHSVTLVLDIYTTQVSKNVTYIEITHLLPSLQHKDNYDVRNCLVNGVTASSNGTTISMSSLGHILSITTHDAAHQSLLSPYSSFQLICHKIFTISQPQLDSTLADIGTINVIAARRPFVDLQTCDTCCATTLKPVMEIKKYSRLVSGIVNYTSPRSIAQCYEAKPSSNESFLYVDTILHSRFFLVGAHFSTVLMHVTISSVDSKVYSLEPIYVDDIKNDIISPIPIIVDPTIQINDMRVCAVVYTTKTEKTSIASWLSIVFAQTDNLHMLDDHDDDTHNLTLGNDERSGMLDGNISDNDHGNHDDNSTIQQQYDHHLLPSLPSPSSTSPSQQTDYIRDYNTYTLLSIFPLADVLDVGRTEQLVLTQSGIGQWSFVYTVSNPIIVPSSITLDVFLGSFVLEGSYEHCTITLGNGVIKTYDAVITGTKTSRGRTTSISFDFTQTPFPGTSDSYAIACPNAAVIHNSDVIRPKQDGEKRHSYIAMKLTVYTTSTTSSSGTVQAHSFASFNTLESKRAVLPLVFDVVFILIISIVAVASGWGYYHKLSKAKAAKEKRILRITSFFRHNYGIDPTEDDLLYAQIDPEWVDPDHSPDTERIIYDDSDDTSSDDTSSDDDDTTSSNDDNDSDDDDDDDDSDNTLSFTLPTDHQAHSINKNKKDDDDDDVILPRQHHHHHSLHTSSTPTHGRHHAHLYDSSVDSTNLNTLRHQAQHSLQHHSKTRDKQQQQQQHLSSEHNGLYHSTSPSLHDLPSLTSSSSLKHHNSQPTHKMDDHNDDGPDAPLLG